MPAVRLKRRRATLQAAVMALVVLGTCTVSRGTAQTLERIAPTAAILVALSEIAPADSQIAVLELAGFDDHASTVLDHQQRYWAVRLLGNSLSAALPTVTNERCHARSDSGFYPILRIAIYLTSATQKEYLSSCVRAAVHLLINGNIDAFAFNEIALKLYEMSFLRQQKLEKNQNLNGRFARKYLFSRFYLSNSISFAVANGSTFFPESTLRRVLADLRQKRTFKGRASIVDRHLNVVGAVDLPLPVSSNVRAYSLAIEEDNVYLNEEMVFLNGWVALRLSYRDDLDMLINGQGLVCDRIGIRLGLGPNFKELCHPIGGYDETNWVLINEPKIQALNMPQIRCSISDASLLGRPDMLFLFGHGSLEMLSRWRGQLCSAEKGTLK